MEQPLFETLRQIAEKRHSVRAFSEREVDAALVEKMLVIAETSPYATSRKNWGIEVVRDRALIERAARAVEQKIASMRNDVRESYRDAFDNYAKNFSFFGRAPLLLVPCYRVSPTVSALFDPPGETLAEWERDNFVKSISCVTMLLLLAAESLGLGACCVTGALIAEEELTTILPIKNGRRIGALVPVGYEQPKDIHEH
jgi:nitroreductase